MTRPVTVSSTRVSTLILFPSAGAIASATAMRLPSGLVTERLTGGSSVSLDDRLLVLGLGAPILPTVPRACR